MMNGLGDRIVSVILRGSLARGFANPADIDLMIVLRDPRERSPVLPTLPILQLPIEIGVL
ncbi:nucleotidyltransferase domain-containing protein [Jannaschia pohangensis]|uniref:nucleotidyltransferase domain-containing protein n=1 Tax=Jannaschia pohangensis TaxID=390807 RepID=UPI000B851549|nr:nucleotidyltransferase domain-containing protein [Jannaschia pohangensis]